MREPEELNPAVKVLETLPTPCLRNALLNPYLNSNQDQNVRSVLFFQLNYKGIY